MVVVRVVVVRVVVARVVVARVVAVAVAAMAAVVAVNHLGSVDVASDESRSVLWALHFPSLRRLFSHDTALYCVAGKHHLGTERHDKWHKSADRKKDHNSHCNTNRIRSFV